ncbi:MAG: Ig-like domain-containing protein [Bacteroidales bacterium]
MKRSLILFYLFLISSALLLTHCAKPVSPTGGPKDVTPPAVVLCDPPNFTPRFSRNSFRIDFNEFITVKNAVSEIFISPPLKSPLDTRLRGKSLIVKFDDTLAQNSTYSITFGNSITDLTEGNVLKDFNYVFSTGDFIDSLSLRGNLQTAFDHKVQKDVFVELYMNNNDTLPLDSLPLKVVPYYITKTDEQGNFKFHNLRNEPFKLFALADQNGDMIFNQPSEKIAFADSLIKPYFIAVAKRDTTDTTTLVINPKTTTRVTVKIADSIRKSDSTRKADSVSQSNLQYPSYPLFLFEESDSVQRILRSTFPMEGLVTLAFRFPVKDLEVIPLNFDSAAPWHVKEYSKNRDSVRLWITRPMVDSLVAKVLDGNRILDTLHLEFIKKPDSKKPSEKKKGASLTMSNSASGAGLNQFRNNLIVTFSHPLIRWNFKRVLLISAKDTIHPKIAFFDSLKRKIVVSNKWAEDKSYKLLVPDSVFVGIHDISHDSILMEFKTKSEKDFGNLILTMKMENRPGQYIVQLLNEKESFLYEEQVINGSGKIHFNFMPPGKYKLKAIHDRNSNRRWDTGKYKLNIQPEEVIYLPKIVEIRANWDVEENWD